MKSRKKEIFAQPSGCFGSDSVDRKQFFTTGQPKGDLTIGTSYGRAELLFFFPNFLFL